MRDKTQQWAVARYRTITDKKKTTMQIYKIVTNTDPIKYIGIKNKSS
jgi:hypothetical protein